MFHAASCCFMLHVVWWTCVLMLQPNMNMPASTSKNRCSSPTEKGLRPGESYKSKPISKNDLSLAVFYFRIFIWISNLRPRCHFDHWLELKKSDNQSILQFANVQLFNREKPKLKGLWCLNKKSSIAELRSNICQILNDISSGTSPIALIQFVMTS